MIIEIEVKPVPAPRPRFSRFGSYNKKNYTEYKKKIAWSYKANNGILFDNAVDISLEFCYQFPKSWSKKKKKNADMYLPKGDVDNLAKGVLDALNGIAYRDDKQVRQLSVSKRYAERDLVIIEIKESK